jgi:hypothetical protein
MENLSDFNNRAGRLIDQRDLEGATKLLDEIEALLKARPPLVIDRHNIDPALDEYFYLSHRVRIGWLRGAYEETLPLARRVWELEEAIFEAKRWETGAEAFAMSTGGWAIISFLTRCRQFDAAAEIFDQVMTNDPVWFDARCARNRAAAEQLVVAGMCIYLESRDPTLVEGAQRLIGSVQHQMRSSQNLDLAYVFVRFWALADDVNETFRALQHALALGYPLDNVLADPTLQPLHHDRRWLESIVPKQLQWSISSVPSSARVLLDGVEIGYTPVQVRRPARGKHLLRFSYPEFRDSELEIDEDESSDERVITHKLTRSVPLPTAQQIVSRESRSDVDEATRAKTRAFLGKHRGTRVRVVRGTTYMLGGLTVIVHRNGTVTIEKQAFGNHEQAGEHQLTLPAKEAELIFGAFIDEAFTEMVIDQHAGLPDMLHFSIELTNDAGNTHRLGKFIAPPYERFDKLVRIVLGVVDLHLTDEQRDQFR